MGPPTSEPPFDGIERAFAPSDIKRDGDADLHDFALFHTCFRQTNLTGPCATLDLHPDDTIDPSYFALFHDIVFSQ